MDNFVKRCKADLWCRIPMLVCTSCLLLMLLLPEPWRSWAMSVGGVALLVCFVAVCRNIGKDCSDKQDTEIRYPIIERLDDALLVCVFVLAFLVLIWDTWIAPLMA